MVPINSPQYFGGNWALAMHGCKGHSLVQHGKQRAPLLACELHRLELALHRKERVMSWAMNQDNQPGHVCRPTFLSWRTDKTNSCSSAVLAGADTPSMSVSTVKSHLFVMVSESGCWVVMQLDVMHKTRRYFPRHDALVHKYRAMQSGGVCPSAACRK